MVGKIVRIALALTSSALIIPYALAFFAEMLYGKSKKSADEFLKSMHPTRVYKFTQSLLMQMKTYKYIGLYLKWTKHYQTLSEERITKNITYGYNNNTLDVYRPPRSFPPPTSSSLIIPPKPIIIFLYGETWSSGDKNMYSLLCCNLATKFNAIVICPNYSIYPKGFVDDMVQDVHDVLLWASQNAHHYSADKTKITLLGHSAGAHLASLTVLELAVRRQQRKDPPQQRNFKNNSKDSSVRLEVSVLDDSFRFYDNHFLDSSSNRESLTDLTVLNDEENEQSEEGEEEEDKAEGEEDEDEKEKNEGAEEDEDENNVNYSLLEDSFKQTSIHLEENISTKNTKEKSLIEGNGKEKKKDEKENEGEGGVNESVNSNTSDSFVMVSHNIEKNNISPNNKTIKIKKKNKKQFNKNKNKEINKINVDSINNEENCLIHKNKSLSLFSNQDLLSNVKLVICLAGIYDIEAQYKKQEEQAREHMSHMTRAMYDQNHFRFFSPNHMLKGMSNEAISYLPAFYLLHGTEDNSVSSDMSLSFGESLWNRDMRDLKVSILRGCDHFQIFIDLMETDRRWYQTVISEIRKGMEYFVGVSV